MRATEIKSCYIGPEISPEQFVPEHFFVYLGKGKIHGYDGHRYNTLSAGEYGVVRKNCLMRYNKERENGEFEKVLIIFDEPFLRSFQQKHQLLAHDHKTNDAFLLTDRSGRVTNFVESLMPHYSASGRIDGRVANEKREELLLMLLQEQPQLSGALFDYGIPQKINIEAFMNRNFRFNVSIQRFAFLTGRSVSSFKRDFKQTFNDTPNRWLTRRRLAEAHFLIEKKNKRPSEIYLDLGFENLSHFSYAFKKLFGRAPSQTSVSVNTR